MGVSATGDPMRNDHNTEEQMKGLLETAKDVIGSTPQEAMMKLFALGLTIVANMVEQVALPMIIFIGIVLGDAVLGTILAKRDGKPLKPWKWVTGPMLKILVMGIFIAMMALVDALVVQTPLHHMMESPFVIGAAFVATFAMAVESAGKAQRLTGFKLLDPLVRRIAKLTGQEVEIQPKTDEEKLQG